MAVFARGSRGERRVLGEASRSGAAHLAGAHRAGGGRAETGPGRFLFGGERRRRAPAAARAARRMVSEPGGLALILCRPPGDLHRRVTPPRGRTVTGRRRRSRELVAVPVGVRGFLASSATAASSPKGSRQAEPARRRGPFPGGAPAPEPKFRALRPIRSAGAGVGGGRSTFPMLAYRPTDGKAQARFSAPPPRSVPQRGRRKRAEGPRDAARGPSAEFGSIGRDQFSSRIGST